MNLALRFLITINTCIGLLGCDDPEMFKGSESGNFAPADEDEGVPMIDDAASDASDSALPEGGPGDFENSVEPAAASCVGYKNGGNYCLANCWDNPGHWVPIAHITNTAFGECGKKVDNYCAWHWGTYGACWGWP